MAERYWTCQRIHAGEKCGRRNPARLRNCAACGGRKRDRRPKHRAVLREVPYAEWVARHGELCGICGRVPALGKRLHRDHDHRSGLPRGLLCFRCNSALRSYMTLDWLRRAVVYLERGERV